MHIPPPRPLAPTQSVPNEGKVQLTATQTEFVQVLGSILAEAWDRITNNPASPYATELNRPDLPQ